MALEGPGFEPKTLDHEPNMLPITPTLHEYTTNQKEIPLIKFSLKYQKELLKINKEI